MAKKSKPAEVPREGVNTRITRELRDKLDAAAAASGRSVGSEIERRLERSFVPDTAILLEWAGDHKTLSIMTTMLNAWKMLSMATNKPWHDDVDSIEAARHAANLIIDLFKDNRISALIETTRSHDAIFAAVNEAIDPPIRKDPKKD